MKKFNVKLKETKVVSAASLAELRKKIGDEHSVDPEKFKFVKPLIKDEAAFSKLADGSEIVILGTIIPKKVERTPEEQEEFDFLNALTPAEKKRLKICMETDLEFMGWDPDKVGNVKQYVVWIAVVYGMPDLRRWILRRLQQGGKSNEWNNEYVWMCNQVLKADIDNVPHPQQFFCLELTWHRFRRFSHLGITKSTHPYEMIMEWRRIVALNYRHPRRRVDLMENLFGFRHTRKIEKLYAPHDKNMTREFPSQFPDGILELFEDQIIMDINGMIRTKFHKSLVDPTEGKAVQGKSFDSNMSLFNVRKEDKYFEGDTHILFDSQFIGLVGRLPTYFFIRLQRWSGKEGERKKDLRCINIPRTIDLRSICTDDAKNICKSGTDKLDYMLTDKYKEAIDKKIPEIRKRKGCEQYDRRDLAMLALEEVVPKFVYDDMFYELNDCEWPDSGTTTYRLCSFMTTVGYDETPEKSHYGAGFRYDHGNLWYFMAGTEVERFTTQEACVSRYSGLTGDEERGKEPRDAGNTHVIDLLIYRRIFVDIP